MTSDENGQIIDVETFEVDAGSNQSTFTSEALKNVIDGDDEPNELVGSDADEIINGFGGDDVLAGLGGADVLNGGKGDDTLVGGKGDDHKFGEDGDDRLVWNNGDGSDLMDGGKGHDVVQVNFNTDLVNDDLQNDDVASIAPDAFARIEVNGQTEAGLFELTLKDVEEIEVNFGGGDDTAVIDEAALNETGFKTSLDGGADNAGDHAEHGKGDTLDFSTVSEGVAALFDTERQEFAVLDVPEIGPRDGIIGANPFAQDADEPGEGEGEEEIDREQLLTDAIDNAANVEFKNFENVVGTDFDDLLLTDDGANVLKGGDGDDEMFGFGGVDLLLGGNDQDVLIGGKGNDEFFGEAGNDVLIWNNGDGSDLMDGGAGVDRLQVNFDTDLVNDDLQNDDVAEVNATEHGFEFARVALNGQTKVGLFQLDSREIEELEVNFGGGDDVGRFDDPHVDGLKIIADGGAGEDEIRTGSGDDQISGGNDNDRLYGGAGDDILAGNLGDDSFFGEAGDDLMVWNNGDGSDLMVGGDGADRTQVNFQQNTDLSDLDLQNDDVAAFSVTDEGVQFARVELNGQTERGLFQLDIRETEELETNFGGGDDTALITGDVLDQIALDLDGGDGIDTLDFSGIAVDDPAELFRVGLSNNVIEIDGEPSDAIFVNFENIIGSDNNDIITGDDGANVLEGRDGDDRLEGLGGDDVLVGNLGNDEMFGGAGDDLMVWNNGDGSDLMVGGDGVDRTQVNFQQNTDLSDLDVQNNDVAAFSVTDDGVQFARVELNGQTERGLFQLDIRETEELETNFGGGDDTARLIGDVANAIQLVLDGGDGVDTLDASAADGPVEINLAAETAGAVTAINFENVIGSAFDDVIIGDAQDNVFTGGGGADVFVFDVGFGHDQIVDFGAEDQIDLSALGVTALDQLSIVNGKSGATIHVEDGSTIVLQNVEGDAISAEQFIFAEDIVIDGDDGDNRLIGTSASETINGLGGDDEIAGGGGDDIVNGGDGDDVLRGNSGDDQMFGGEGDDAANGGAGDDVIYGDAGDDVLRGNSGDDLVYGGDGDDQVFAGSGDDYIEGGAGNDILAGVTGDDVIYGGDGDDQLLGRAADDQLFGEEGDDRLVGDAGDDILDGGAGRDVLLGGPGDDVMTGGADRDVFVFRTERGEDVITDFEVGLDDIAFRDRNFGERDVEFDDLVFVQDGANAIIQERGLTITLENVDVDDLSVDDFIFG